MPWAIFSPHVDSLAPARSALRAFASGEFLSLLPERLKSALQIGTRVACPSSISVNQRRSAVKLWGGEFGRTPFLQGKIEETKQWGRDHHPYAFTLWMAGGGVKPGLSYGASDDFGFNAIENKVHVHDFQATVLHLPGIDHERRKFQGRHYRLTDVHGNVVKPVLG